MREMKDSGIEWIGNIPATWERCKIKNVISSIGSGTTPTSSNIDYYNSEDICWIQSGDLYKTSYISNTAVSLSAKALHLSALQIYAAPFIVVAMYGASVGNIAISTIDACSNQACCCIKPDNNNDLKFMYYWLSMCKIDFLSQSIGGGQPNISQSKIKNQFYYRPQLSEQKVIANFLDSKCSEIDAISADIQKEIEILEQYKRSVITEAVTKGLNPDVEMKESGIGYIGIIPNHWVVEKIKYHLKYRSNRNPGNVQVLSVYREYGVIPKDSRDDNHNVTSEDTSNYRYVRVGDFVINKMKAWQGSMAISDYEGIVSPAYYVYEFSDEHFDRKYFHYLLRNKMYATEFLRVSGGIRVGQWDLSAYDFENTMVPMPPIKEQKKIAAFLDTKSTEIDSLIGEKKRQLEVLDSYKKSLIYEYVTGKKEVI
jgi:type I restriction enzyme S subunit